MHNAADNELSDAFVFRVSAAWFACEPGIVESVMLVEESRQFRVPGVGEGVIDDAGRSRMLHTVDLSSGGMVDAPQGAARVVCLAHHGAPLAVHSEEVIGLVQTQCDSEGRTVLSVHDAHGHEQTLVLRTDVLDVFFGVAP